MMARGHRLDICAVGLVLLCIQLTCTQGARSQLAQPLRRLLATCNPSCSNALASAASFGVLGASTVTNTGGTMITGDCGVSPGSAITGFPPGQTSGTMHLDDGAATAGQNDAHAAYTNFMNTATTKDISGQDMGGMTLLPGVYGYSSSAGNGGTLTLDAQGNPAAIFIFKIVSSLVTASGSQVVLANGALACNVFFVVGSYATLGTGTNLAGSILAMTSITATTKATVMGSLLAITAAVTLDTNVVATMGMACGSPPPP
uniref:Ice-binding protein 6 n=1 Tax=Chloromonas brevispina TaxID=201318 RepID=A0A060L1F1_9CHLO|nr:ice-binding protein 6 [Chloromonas brevispina]